MELPSFSVGTGAVIAARAAALRASSYCRVPGNSAGDARSSTAGIPGGRRGAPAGVVAGVRDVVE